MNIFLFQFILDHGNIEFVSFSQVESIIIACHAIIFTIIGKASYGKKFITGRNAGL